MDRNCQDIEQQTVEVQVFPHLGVVYDLNLYFQKFEDPILRRRRFFVVAS